MTRTVNVFRRWEIVKKRIRDGHTAKLYEQLAANCQECGITEKRYCDKRIIVSLTTFGKRINGVHLAIESLMQQTVKPNMITLWISEDDFNDDNLPNSVRKLQKRGLTIRYVHDILSYTKLVPALREYPDDVIITVDDDVMYSRDLVGRLVSSYLREPDHIWFWRGHKMVENGKGSFVSYNDWDWETALQEESQLNFPTGVGGVLYPPHSLDDEALNEEAFLSLAPTADDVWFKAMALKKGTSSKMVDIEKQAKDYYVDIDHNMQDSRLYDINVNMSGNDRQIKNVFDKYGLYDKCTG